MSPIWLLDVQFIILIAVVLVVVTLYMHHPPERASSREVRSAYSLSWFAMSTGLLGLALAWLPLIDILTLPLPALGFITGVWSVLKRGNAWRWMSWTGIIASVLAIALTVYALDTLSFGGPS